MGFRRHLHISYTDRPSRRRRGRGVAVGVAAFALVLGAGAGTAGAEDVPSSDTLEQALLEPQDLGPEFARGVNTSPDDSADPVGCPALQNLQRAPSPAGQWPEVRLTTDFVFVQEQLIAGTPQALGTTHARVRDALATCTSLSFPMPDTDPLTVAVTPIRFGGPESAAVRMDGEYMGVPINGYLALEQLGSVELVYVFFQVLDDSSQPAAYAYSLAVDKIHRVVGPAAGPAQPLVTPEPGGLTVPA